jgi:DNA-binding response OmpR family regulator
MATVLIVEDDLDMRELERLALETNGFKVVTVGNGAEALAHLQQKRPCAILLDLMMPVMDGLTFLRERRRVPAAERVPVICVSAAGHEMVVEALRSGAVDCLPKPTDFDELCDIVAGYCRKTRGATHVHE